MATTRTAGQEFRGPAARFFIVLLFLCGSVLYFLDVSSDPRIVRLKDAITDTAAPLLQVVASPVRALDALFSDFGNFTRVYEENERLRHELQKLYNWREVAFTLEEENARLRHLNNVRLAPRISYLTTEVIADSGGPFTHSVLVNVGAQAGITDGAPVIDGDGVVGRVVGVGERSARVLLLSDINSRVPVLVQPGDHRAILNGDAKTNPLLAFLAPNAGIKPGYRVTTSGDGGVFPSGLFVGVVAEVTREAARVDLAADYSRLEFVRVLHTPDEDGPQPSGGLILDEPKPIDPTAPLRLSFGDETGEPTP